MDPNAQIDLIKREIADAADALISASLQGLQLVGRARTGDAAALDGLEAVLCSMMEACAFQDLSGQRLDRLAAAFAASMAEPERDPLLNGPADPGRGLDQGMADDLLAAQAVLVR